MQPLRVQHKLIVRYVLQSFPLSGRPNASRTCLLQAAKKTATVVVIGAYLVSCTP